MTKLNCNNFDPVLRCTKLGVLHTHLFKSPILYPIPILSYLKVLNSSLVLICKSETFQKFEKKEQYNQAIRKQVYSERKKHAGPQQSRFGQFLSSSLACVVFFAMDNVV